jgi:hypothetical protein
MHVGGRAEVLRSAYLSNSSGMGAVLQNNTQPLVLYYQRKPSCILKVREHTTEDTQSSSSWNTVSSSVGRA